MTTLCTTGKVGYGRNEANRVMKGMRYSKSLKKKPQRVYFCTECKLWHITSKIKE